MYWPPFSRVYLVTDTAPTQNNPKWLCLHLFIAPPTQEGWDYSAIKGREFDSPP